VLDRLRALATLVSLAASIALIVVVVVGAARAELARHDDSLTGRNVDSDLRIIRKKKRTRRRWLLLLAIGLLFASALLFPGVQ
jgi:hypothetical protein